LEYNAISTVEFRPIEPFGAEVDLDLRCELPDEQADDLRDLFHQHHLLIFRDQPIGPTFLVNAVASLAVAVASAYDVAWGVPSRTTRARLVGLGWLAVPATVFWLLFVTVDLLCGWIAFRLDKGEKKFPAFLLIAQRFVYRQLMYWVVIKAVSAALRGRWVGWGKLERTGRSAAPVAA